MKNAKLINLSGIVLIAVVFLFAAGYFFTLRWTSNVSPVSDAAANSQVAAQSTKTDRAASDENPFLNPAMSNDGGTNITPKAITYMEMLEIITRLVLSVILSGLLAFRPRKNVPLFRRNLYVAQTQILLAVVAAALMMIVGDNTARAFAIFAAVSLVRFRTNIRDPKEITVLLISLAIGLATGVGRWELGLILCLFALILLWILEFKETEQVFRSMQLTVKTRNTDSTQATLKEIFERYKLEAEVRQIDPPAEGGDNVGCIMYYLDLRLNVTTDSLSEEIFKSDGENVDGIQWEQKKSGANIYQ
jgi:uncharacterized membrane protein YhiD involved in acid resistance